MSVEVNKAAEGSALKELNEGNLEGYFSYYDESLVIHGYPPEIPANLDGLKAFYEAIRAAFPDAKVEVEDIVAEGDKLGFDTRVERWQNSDTMGLMAQLGVIPAPEVAKA